MHAGYRRTSNAIVIMLLVASIAFISLFTYAQLALKSRLTVNFVQHAEIKAGLVEQATNLWLKAGHTRGVDFDLMELRDSISLSGHRIFDKTGSLVFRQQGDILAQPEEQSIVSKVIQQGNHVEIFDGKRKRFTRYSPIRNEGSCLRCHDGDVVGVLKAEFQVQDEFALLAWISKLIWGLAGIMVLTIGGLIVSIVIIKEKRRVSSQLHEAKESLQMILDYSKAIIITTDMGGRISEFNREAELLSGYKKSEVIGRYLLFLCPNAKQRFEAVSAIRSAQLKSGSEWEVRNKQIEIRSRMGSEIFITATYSPLLSDSGAVGVVIVCKDITEQLGLQKKLIQSEKLAGIGTLASGVAHEINNPLAGILGMAEAAIDEQDPVLCKTYLNDIITYVLNASSIVKELTAYSRKASKRETKKIDIGAIINDSLRMAAHSAPLTRIHVHFQLEPCCYINGNAGELQQVFVNLIVNAIHAMDGGDLTLKCWQQEQKVCAQVIDTGIGIPQQNLNQIHDPFFTSKPVGKGTGLGLYVVYTIVTKYGGTFDCDSTEGQGTCMTLVFNSANKLSVIEGGV